MHRVYSKVGSALPETRKRHWTVLNLDRESWIDICSHVCKKYVALAAQKGTCLLQPPTHIPVLGFGPVLVLECDVTSVLIRLQFRILDYVADSAIRHVNSCDRLRIDSALLNWPQKGNFLVRFTFCVCRSIPVVLQTPGSVLKFCLW